MKKYRIVSTEIGMVLGTFGASSDVEAIDMFCALWWEDGSFDELADINGWDYDQFKTWFMNGKNVECVSD